MKKIFSVLLAILMVFTAAVTGSAASVQADVYSFYADGMLFKQNETAVISGISRPGSVIAVELYGSDGRTAAQGVSVTGADGEFSVVFDAPSGSYEEYTLVLKADGVKFETLDNVVFGELWLSAGQSNMQYPLIQDKDGAVMYAENKKLGKWLRVMLVPAVNEYKDSTGLVPYEPQKDIAGVQWVNGENEAVYNMSAVAYFFAASTARELDMPVGIISAALGGSVIASWISPDAVDGCPEVRDMLASFGEYYTADTWNEAERSIYYDMGCNFNLKIAPLRNMKLSGMIWYQGESDVIFGKTAQQYGQMFDLMQKSYTEHFGYTDGLLPVVFTQLASYPYHNTDGSDLLDMNIGFTHIQSQQSASRAVVPIYDIPLTYLEAAGAIHPECKREIGERMAYSAGALVYGGDYDYTAPSAQSYEIRDGKVYVTITNAGDGLMCKGTELRGFAVADESGVFVKADARIADKNTVIIYNEKVKTPVAASYAYSLGNMNANLYSSEDGRICMPVSPFVTSKPDGAKYSDGKQWAECEYDRIWRVTDDEFSDYYDSWTGKNAEIDFSDSLDASGFSGEFTLSPVITARNGLKNVRFDDEDYNYNDYGSVSFKVRNNGCEKLVFKGLRISISSVNWYETAADEVEIPADGQWHEVTAVINNIHIYGVDFGVTLSNDALCNVTELEFIFDGTEGTMSLDDVRFCGENEASVHNDSFDFTKIYNIGDVVRIFFLGIAEYFAQLTGR